MTTDDSINWDIVRNYISNKVEEFLIKNRNNTLNSKISQLCRNIDIDGKQTSYYIDVLIDEIYISIYQYVKFQDIKTSYTLNQRLKGRADIEQPAPHWCQFPRQSTQYEIATTHDGIICSRYITSFLKNLQENKLKGYLPYEHEYKTKLPIHLRYNQ